MNDITIFNSPQFGDIRTAGTAEAPLFCLADVCKALGLTSKFVNQRLDKGVVSNHPLETAGGTQQALFVNEDGLYDVILDSRKPEAKVFRKWVTSEVLPAIRRHGAYMTDDAIARALDDPDTIIRLATNLKAERQARIAAEAENRELKRDSDYLNEILRSKGTVTMTQIAADYGMSTTALNERLRMLRIQRKVSGQWVLYAPYLANGYVKSETVRIVHRDGRNDTKMHSRWTQRGRLFLYNALKEVGVLPLIEQEVMFAQ